MFDLQEHFELYDKLFFESKLKQFTKVMWYNSRKNYGVCQCHSNSCTVKLSKYLLKYSGYEDIRDTLIHEMVHAYIYLENIEIGDDHGDVFQTLNNSILEQFVL